MKRIVIHWSAGTHKVSALDREHYHFIVSGEGEVVAGKWPVSANAKLQPGRYAAHTLNLNTDSIGIAVAAMAGAVERPFDAGDFPITEKQMAALVDECAALAVQYGIPVRRDTILTHAEVQPTLGVKQRGKWDITWLPGMPKPLDPVYVGDIIRDRIMDAMKPAPVLNKEKPVEHVSGFWAAFLAWLKGMMK